MRSIVCFISYHFFSHSLADLISDVGEREGVWKPIPLKQMNSSSNPHLFKLNHLIQPGVIELSQTFTTSQFYTQSRCLPKWLLQGGGDRLRIQRS